MEEIFIEEQEGPPYWAVILTVMIAGALCAHFFITFKARSQKALSGAIPQTATVLPVERTPMPGMQSPEAIGQDRNAFLMAVFAPPTPTRTLEPEAGAIRLSPIDGMAQVYIPSGQFYMGKDAPDGIISGDNQPRRQIFLDGYWINQTTVTNLKYSQCVAAGACGFPCSPETNPPYYDPAYANHPVVYVSWMDAQRYCEWAGGSLPSEAQWERAAGGSGNRLFAWGNDEPAENLANVNGFRPSTTVVGSYPDGVSPFGVFDMGGNVREWVADWYDPNYYRVAPQRNPVNMGAPANSENESAKVLRGASWNDPWEQSQISRRYAHRPDSPGNNRGFRCTFQ